MTTTQETKITDLGGHNHRASLVEPSPSGYVQSSPTTAFTSRGSRHVGPPLLPLALISVALFAASLVVGATGGGPFPSPYDHSRDVVAFFSAHATTVRFAATLQFASAVPLAILAASLSSRVRYLGFARGRRRTVATTPSTDEGITP